MLLHSYEFLLVFLHVVLICVSILYLQQFYLHRYAFICPLPPLSLFFQFSFLFHYRYHLFEWTAFPCAMHLPHLWHDEDSNSGWRRRGAGAGGRDGMLTSVRDVNKNPTRCNSMQIFIYYKVTLHVSDVTAPIIRSTKNCNRSLRYRS